MNAVTQRDETNVAEVSGSLLSVIERAARDPSVDIEKLERLFALKERMDAQEAKRAFIEGKIAMRAELPEITMKGHIIIRDRNDQNKIIQDTPFARFEDIHEAVMPVLTAHGFDLAFRNGLAPDGKVRVTTILSHRDGHEESTDFDLPHDGSGSKNAVQAVGSSTSYGKRYGVLSILNIKVAGEDDDGDKASYKDPTGEPLARTKLDGPHTSKTALKQAVQSLRIQVRECITVEELNKLLKVEKPTIDQAQRDWDTLLTGDPQIAEDIGLRGDVEARRAYLRQHGAAYAGLLKSMLDCDTLTKLHRWRGANEAEIEALGAAEGRHFERQWEVCESNLSGVGQ